MLYLRVVEFFFAAAAAMEMHRNAASSSGIMGRNMNE
jgi:hypothetical protein